MLPCQWIHTFITFLFENSSYSHKSGEVAKKVLYHDKIEISNNFLASLKNYQVDTLVPWTNVILHCKWYKKINSFITLF